MGMMILAQVAHHRPGRTPRICCAKGREVRPAAAHEQPRARGCDASVFQCLYYNAISI